jgi:triosephosphate isomerase
VRRLLIVGNWKMHKTTSEAAEYVRRLLTLVPETIGIEAVLAPPFTALQAVRDALAGDARFVLAAQNLFWEDQGAFTGEISGPMLKDLGCRYVIVGHSERRQIFGEQDELINRKVRAAVKHGVRPILCVGESVDERDADRTDAVVTGQLLKGLAGLRKEDVAAVTIAYEPVWAIGTGRAASPEQAAAVHRAIRKKLAEQWGTHAEAPIRVLYGGSVTPQNAASLLANDQIDGALVGGACLDPNAFATILAAAQARAACPR